MTHKNKTQQRLVSAAMLAGLGVAAVAGFNHLNPTENTNKSDVFGAQEGDGQYCYLLADIHEKGGDEMIEDIITKYDFKTGKETHLSGDQMQFIGTKNAEALEYDYENEKLYVVEQSKLWTVDLETGKGTAKDNKFGWIQGEYGPLEAKKINSLAKNPDTGDFFAVNRDTQRFDQLFVVDVETGKAVKNFFGEGKDYIPVEEPDKYREIDDLAFDLVTNELYGLSGVHGREGISTDIVRINMETGKTTILGNTDLLDVEGLSFNPEGKLYVSTGNWGEPKDHLYEVNTLTGEAIKDTAISLPLASDYEGLDCLISKPIVSSSSSESSESSEFSETSSSSSTQSSSESEISSSSSESSSSSSSDPISSSSSSSLESSQSSVSQSQSSSSQIISSTSLSSSLSSSLAPIVDGDEDVVSSSQSLTIQSQSRPAGQVLGDESSLVRSGGGIALAGFGVFTLLSVYGLKLRKALRKIKNDTQNLKG